MASPICDHCLTVLPWNPAACRVCGLPNETGFADCGRCPEGWAISETIAPLLYQTCAADWVISAKRQAGVKQAALLGYMLAEAAVEHLRCSPAVPPPDYLIPVPLSWRRLTHRGHNQAVLIARPVSRATSIPLLVNAVRRSRHTPIQPLAPSRESNVSQAFTNHHTWHGERVVVIDDVMTSGATVNAIANLLKSNGAGEVFAWCSTRAVSS